MTQDTSNNRKISGERREPIPRSEVGERWLETCHNPEMRVIEISDKLKPLYAIAEAWDYDTGLPVEEKTLWYGDKGDFYSLWHAVTAWARRNEPELFDHYNTDSDQ